MEFMEIVAWVVWGLSAGFLMLWASTVGKRYAARENVGWYLVFPLIWGFLALGLTVGTNVSKFHLLWMIPLGVIFPLSVLCFQLGTKLHGIQGRWQEAMQQMAAEIAIQNQLYVGPVEFVEVRPEDFSGLDLAWYDELAEEIKTVTGARFVVDLECPILTEIAPERRTFCRCLSAEDGSLLFFLQNIRLQDDEGRLIRDQKTVELQTAFDDGCFLSTSNTRETSPVESCAGLAMLQFSSGTIWEDLLRAHRLETAEKANEDGGKPIPVTTKEEIIAVRKRQHDLRRAAWEPKEGEAMTEE